MSDYDTDATERLMRDENATLKGQLHDTQVRNMDLVKQYEHIEKLKRALEEKTQALERQVSDVRAKNIELEIEMGLMRGTRKQANGAVIAQLQNDKRELKEENRHLRETMSGGFLALRKANEARNEEWDPDHNIATGFRGLETGGEIGELMAEVMNVVRPMVLSLMVAAAGGKVQGIMKKLERERMGLVGSRSSLDELGREMADVIICVDLLAMHLGLDLWGWTRTKFNETSEKYGLKTKIP